MLKILSNILCDLDPKVKVIGQKAGICDGVPSTSALVLNMYLSNEKNTFADNSRTYYLFDGKTIVFFETFFLPFLWAILH